MTAQLAAIPTLQLSISIYDQIALTVAVFAELDAIIIDSAWGYSRLPHQNSASPYFTSSGISKSTGLNVMVMVAIRTT